MGIKHLEADNIKKDDVISSLSSDLLSSRLVNSKGNTVVVNPPQEEEIKTPLPQTSTASEKSVSGSTSSDKRMFNFSPPKLRSMTVQDIVAEGLTFTQDAPGFQEGDMMVLLSMELKHLQEVARVRAFNQDVLEEKLEVVTERLRHQVEENRMFKPSRLNSTSGSSGIQSEEEADMELVLKGAR